MLMKKGVSAYGYCWISSFELSAGLQFGWRHGGEDRFYNPAKLRRSCQNMYYYFYYHKRLSKDLHLFK
ncbi:hypothetical protein HanIR_Chr05g0250101 [Helianthus annuus]|nr:hypothetical protein HanIR_Chr05g0250101 [Helianthus annuus]